MRTRVILNKHYVQTLAVVQREDKSVQNVALYCGPLSLQRVGVKRGRSTAPRFGQNCVAVLHRFIALHLHPQQQHLLMPW